MKRLSLRYFAPLGLGLLLGATGVQAQSRARLSLDDLQDASVNGQITLAVEARQLQDTRSLEVRLVTNEGAVRWDAAAVGEGAEGMTLLDQRQQGDTLSVVLSHLSRNAGTTLLRTRPVLRLTGTRLRAGAIRFQLAPSPVAVVSRSGTVQPVDVGGDVVTDAEHDGPATETALLGAWPNPAQRTVAVWFESASGAQATLTLYDLMGRAVVRNVAPVGAGRHSLPVDVSGLAPGAYLYTLRLDAPNAARAFTGHLTLVR